MKQIKTYFQGIKTRKEAQQKLNEYYERCFILPYEDPNCLSVMEYSEICMEFYLLRF